MNNIVNTLPENFNLSSSYRVTSTTARIWQDNTSVDVSSNLADGGTIFDATTSNFRLYKDLAGNYYLEGNVVTVGAIAANEEANLLDLTSFKELIASTIEFAVPIAPWQRLGNVTNNVVSSIAVRWKTSVGVAPPAEGILSVVNGSDTADVPVGFHIPVSLKFTRSLRF